MRVDDFVRFIEKRELHRMAKEGARIDPKALDPIITKYRFCNVRREDDRVTKWIAENWRGPNEDHPFIWFAMIVARLLNNPDSLDAVGFLIPWNPDTFRRELKRRKVFGFKNFNAAYIVSTNGRQMDKVDYIVDFILTPIWRRRVEIGNTMRGQTLEEIHAVLEGLNGLGSFMAAQVVADIKYTPAYRAAGDWHTFAASGPGSRRGLNRVMGRPVDASWAEYGWRLDLEHLREAALKKLPKPLKNLHAQDIQNCLCEFDKYERVRLGEGSPKQLYKPREL